jgi:hypothetical protein
MDKLVKDHTEKEEEWIQELKDEQIMSKGLQEKISSLESDLHS